MLTASGMLPCCSKALVGFLLLLAALPGCHGSRWAKRDADYRQKYPEHTDNPLRTIKQAVDARYVAGKSGAYVAAAGRNDPLAAGAEFGWFDYPMPWVEYRGGLAGLLHATGKHPLSGGLVGSVRVQPPSRLAPFVGVGAYGGWAGERSATSDGLDNDHDGSVDEVDEDDTDMALAVFPELGAHFWINHRTRLTTSVSYQVTNQGRDNDYLFYSIGFSWFDEQYETRPMQMSGDFAAVNDLEPLPPPLAVNDPKLASSPYASLEIPPPAADAEPSAQDKPNPYLPPLEDDRTDSSNGASHSPSAVP